MLRTALLATILALSLTAAAARPAAAEIAAGVIKREVLALYDGSEEGAADKTRIHRFAEMPLNYLGFSLVYRDVRGELPSGEELARFAAVVSWFGETPQNSYGYLRWAIAAAGSGVKFIIMGVIGGERSASGVALGNRLLETIGLAIAGEPIDMTYGTKSARVNKEFYEFEIPLGPVFSAYPMVSAVSADVTPILVVEVPGTGGRSILAAIGPGGGYAAANYALRQDEKSGRFAWLLNPFVFFARAIEAPLFPIPDVTTVSGNRLYFSQINGDGFRNASWVEAYRGKVSAEVTLRELIAAFPDLPVTVGIVAGDVSAELGGDPALVSIAREIFAKPQVEVGSGSATLPFSWESFKNYSEDNERAPAGGNGRVGDVWAAFASPFRDAWNMPFGGKAASPRAYARTPFRLDTEVQQALSITNALAPPGKRVMLYQWSGDALPFEAAVKRTRAANLVNINGGGTRLDREFPSVAYVPPISRQVGSERQIYAAGSGDGDYTNNWTGPLYGFGHLLETIRNTDSPRRLKGFDVFYHFNSAERRASLDAVRTVLGAARNMELTPIATSRYASIADSFFETRIESLAPRRWSISNRGALNTVRFDHASGLAIDYERSEGVIGDTRHAGSIYVALDAKAAKAIVTIQDRGPTEGGVLKQPVLFAARWLVQNLSFRSACGFSYQAQGFGKGSHLWRVERAKRYTATASRDGRVLFQGQTESSEDGALELIFPDIAIEPVQIEVQCL